MAISAASVNSAALMSPRVSSGEVKFKSVVAIVPITTALLSHFCRGKGAILVYRSSGKYREDKNEKKYQPNRHPQWTEILNIPNND